MVFYLSVWMQFQLDYHNCIAAGYLVIVITQYITYVDYT